MPLQCSFSLLKECNHIEPNKLKNEIILSVHLWASSVLLSVPFAHFLLASIFYNLIFFLDFFFFLAVPRTWRPSLILLPHIYSRKKSHTLALLHLSLCKCTLYTFFFFQMHCPLWQTNPPPPPHNFLTIFFISPTWDLAECVFVVLYE